MGNWKAVRIADSNITELYDLSTDKFELNNVASLHPEIVAKMEDILLKKKS